MCLRFFGFIVAALVAAWITPSPLSAQIGLNEGLEGVQYSILPNFGFSSDVGFYGGGIVKRTDYGMGIRPFRNQTGVELTASTRGNFSGIADHERIRSFGTDIRSRFRLEAVRLVNQTFFDIGNDSEFSESAYRDGDYYYKDRGIRFDFQGRQQVGVYGSNGRIDWQFLTSVSYNIPASLGEGTVFDEADPAGAEGGWANLIGTGVIVDYRTGDVDPSDGYRFEWKLESAGSLTASDFTFTRMIAEATAYYSPFRNLVIAQKLEVQRARGDTPFWELPVLGHERGLRGYVSNRFRDQNAILHILELRMWLFEFMDEKFRLGLHGFMDTGRVFPKGESLGDLLSGLKQTFGIGGAVSILNPDFILRGEIAFSDEINRVYFGIGYLF